MRDGGRERERERERESPLFLFCVACRSCSVFVFGYPMMDRWTDRWTEGRMGKYTSCRGESKVSSGLLYYFLLTIRT